MSVIISDEPGVVLHSVPYKETSLLVTLYTLNFGKINAVVRLSSKIASRNRGIFEPFSLLRISLTEGKSSLFTINSVFFAKTCV